MRLHFTERILSLLLPVALVSCGFLPEKVALDDPKIQPMLVAISKVDRTTLGFTPIPPKAQVTLRRNGPGYDVMLWIREETLRTVAFRQTPDGYRWIHEQETHTGPDTYETVDGTFSETIVFTYETEQVSGHPRNRINVRYFGEDPRLGQDLTPQDVAPILAEWRAKRHSGRGLDQIRVAEPDQNNGNQAPPR